MGMELESESESELESVVKLEGEWAERLAVPSAGCWEE